MVKLSDQIDITKKSKRGRRSESHHKQTMDLAKPGANDDTVTRLRTRHVNPKLIKLFPYRDRNVSIDDESKYQDLIDSIQKEGDQINPAVVRQTDDPDYPYELIVGQRRMNACIKNGIRLLVLVKELTDREAAKMVNAENNDREDTTPFEKSLHALSMWDSGIYESQDELREDLNIPQSSLSERLNSASLSKHSFIYKLLDPVIDINVSKALKLSQAFAKKKNLQETEKYINANYGIDSALVGQPNKIIDDVLAMIERINKPKSTTSSIVLEKIKVDGMNTVLKRDRKGKVKIELEYFPDNPEDFFADFVAQAKKKL